MAPSASPGGRFDPENPVATRQNPSQPRHVRPRRQGSPTFKAQAVNPDGSFSELSLESYRGKYVVLFFYPLDFTFVCPSEIIAFDNHLAEFKERGAEVIGVSVDSHFSHWAWRNTAVENGGIGEIGYPSWPTSPRTSLATTTS